MSIDTHVLLELDHLEARIAIDAGTQQGKGLRVAAVDTDDAFPVLDGLRAQGGDLPR